MFKFWFLLLLVVSCLGGELSLADKCGAMGTLDRPRSRTKKQFIEETLPLVPALAEYTCKKYGSRSEYDDLVAIGQLSVVEMAQSNVTGSIIQTTIYRAMANYLRKQSPYQRAFPEMRDFKRADSSLRKQLQREPTPLELATNLDWNYEKVKKVQALAVAVDRVQREVRGETKGWFDPSRANRFTYLDDKTPFKDPITRLVQKGQYPAFEDDDNPPAPGLTEGFWEVNEGPYDDPLTLLIEIEDYQNFVEDSRRFVRAIGRLPYEQRQVARLTFVKGLKQVEIAKLLGKGRSNINMLLKKAEKQLRAKFGI